MNKKSNGVKSNGIKSNGIKSNGIKSNGIKSNGIVSGLLVGILLLVGSTSWVGNAYADPYNQHNQNNHGHYHHMKDYFVGARQLNQSLRIQEGVKSGSLTKAEAKALRDQQRAINRQQKAMQADGRIDEQEAHQLNEQLDYQSEHIHQYKFNQQR